LVLAEQHRHDSRFGKMKLVTEPVRISFGELLPVES
jgi:hypothetical protein